MLGADEARLIVRLESALTTELTRGSSKREPVERLFLCEHSSDAAAVATFSDSRRVGGQARRR
jgi:hypothetical protein